MLNNKIKKDKSTNPITFIKENLKFYSLIFLLTSFFISFIVIFTEYLNPNVRMNFSVLDCILVTPTITVIFLPSVVLMGSLILLISNYIFKALRMDNLYFKIFFYLILGVVIMPLVPTLIPQELTTIRYSFFKPYYLISVLGIPVMGFLEIVVRKDIS